LQQVIINLVINGIEAMQPATDRPRELVIRSGQDETHRVLVSVTDCGVGSPPRVRTGCSTPSSPLNPVAWAWDYRSAVRSSKLTGDGCRPPTMRGTVRRFNSSALASRGCVVTERAKSSHEPASAKESIVFVIDDDVAMRTTLSSLFRSVGLRVELFGSAKEFAQIKMPDVAAAWSSISGCRGSAVSIFRPNWLRRILASRSSL